MVSHITSTHCLLRQTGLPSLGWEKAAQFYILGFIILSNSLASILHHC